MSRTVTAMYDTRAEAEAARDRLSAAVDVEGRARIIDKTSDRESDTGSGLRSLAVSREDQHVYEEGIRRGGFMLCAEVDGHEDADKIVGILEQTSGVDLDERQAAWRGDGWPGPTGTAPGSFETEARPPLATAGTIGSDRTALASPGSAQNVEEERIPIVEEQLVVGKREVNRGGARVRTYIRETPVQEQVTLREENVRVERRPVDQKIERGTVGSRTDLFQDRTIEMTAVAEEAVVAKEARVTEEVILRKTAEEHVEQIHDAVRRTEVAVEKVGSNSATNDPRSSSDRHSPNNSPRDY